MSTFYPQIALALSMAALVFSFFAVRFTKKKNARSLSLARMTKLEAEMTEVLDALQAVRASMHKLRSRVGMRERREREKNGHDWETGEPSDPEEWYRWARRKYITQKEVK